MLIQFTIAGLIMLYLFLLLTLLEEKRRPKVVKLKLFNILELELNFASERLVVITFVIIAGVVLICSL